MPKGKGYFSCNSPMVILLSCHCNTATRNKKILDWSQFKAAAETNDKYVKLKNLFLKDLKNMEKGGTGYQ